jgi:hypothetical protein
MDYIGRKLEISYHWRTENNNGIPQNHIEALEESANQRIFEQMKEGMTSGELSDNIRMTDDDSADGISYTGWWSLNTTISE